MNVELTPKECGQVVAALEAAMVARYRNTDCLNIEEAEQQVQELKNLRAKFTAVYDGEKEQIQKQTIKANKQ